MNNGIEKFAEGYVQQLSQGVRADGGYLELTAVGTSFPRDLMNHHFMTQDVNYVVSGCSPQGA